MNRRSFLRGMVAVPIVAKAAPVLGTIAELAPAPVATVAKRVHTIMDDFVVDHTNKTIKWMGPCKEGYTIQELYNYLQGVFDEESSFDDVIPVRADGVTLEVVNGWSIPKRPWWQFWRR